MRADAGIMISASHNPFQDNGIKIFSQDGFKLPDEVEAQIEQLIASNQMDSMRPTATEIGRVRRIDDVTGRYIVFLKNTFPKEMRLDGLRLVIDCANGAAYKCAPAVFEELGARIILIGAEPNGENINQNCGALHPELVRERVLKEGADMGLALDGDADRAIFVDNKGNVLNGDHIIAICARDLRDQNKLAKNTVVATVMSNLGLEMALKEMGVHLVRTDVGDRYVLERMRQDGYNLGGEQSGHLIFLDHNTTGDGILSALQVLAVMIRKEQSLSELAEIMEDTPQVLVNVKVSQRVELNDNPVLKKQFARVRETLGEAGRLLVRYSGTEPKVRVMVEGPDSYLIETLAGETADIIGKELG
jgi:phosphoglucosamine mutase